MKPAQYKTLPVLLALPLMLLALNAHAQVKRDPKMQVKGAVSTAQAEISPVEAFKQARAAVGRQDLPRFNQVAPLASQHSLTMYVDYWSLRLRLAQSARTDVPETTDATLNQQAGAFIAKYPTSVAADLLRRDWILTAGKQSDWPRVEALNKDWILQDDKHAQCYVNWLQLKKTGSLEAAVKDSLAYGGTLQEGCDGFAVDAAKLGKLSPEQLQARIATAAFANSGGSIRRLVEGSSVWAAVPFDAVWAKPQATLNQAATRIEFACAVAFGGLRPRCRRCPSANGTFFKRRR
jgi:hypothetical protein